MNALVLIHTPLECATECASALLEFSSFSLKTYGNLDH